MARCKRIQTIYVLSLYDVGRAWYVYNAGRIVLISLNIVLWKTH